MLQNAPSAILSTFIKLTFAINIFVLSIMRGRFTQVLLYACTINLLYTATTTVENSDDSHVIRRLLK